MVKKTRTKRTAKKAKPVESKQDRFLRLFGVHGGTLRACDAAKVGRTTVWEWEQNDPVFAERFKDAKQRVIERFEKEADRRALKGVGKLKFDKDGKALVDPRTDKVYIEETFSDALLMFRLKALDPEKYRERSDVNVHSPEMKLYAGVDLARATGIAAGVKK